MDSLLLCRSTCFSWLMIFESLTERVMLLLFVFSLECLEFFLELALELFLELDNLDWLGRSFCGP